MVKITHQRDSEEFYIVLEDLLRSKNMKLNNNPTSKKIEEFLDFCVLYSNFVRVPIYRKEMLMYFCCWREVYNKRTSKKYKKDLHFLNKFEGRQVAMLPVVFQKESHSLYYPFKNVADLKKFYKNKIQPVYLEKIITSAKKSFVFRKQFSAQENEQQLCKKIQSLLIKELM